MTIEELLDILDMDSTGEIEYSECFCSLMEADAEIPEDVFFILLRELEPEHMGVLMREYMNEIISGIADDCVDFYSKISSYKRSFGGMVNYYTQNEEKDRIIAEIYTFREWYRENGRVRVTFVDDNEDAFVSVCEALIYGRMERLSEGSYLFDYSDAGFPDCGDFEDFVVDDEDEDYENYDYDSPDRILDADYEGYDYEKSGLSSGRGYGGRGSDDSYGAYEYENSDGGSRSGSSQGFERSGDFSGFMPGDNTKGRGYVQ